MDLKQEKWFLRLTFAVCSVLSFLAPCYYAFSRTLGRDWDQFNALSLLVRSSIFLYRKFPLHDPWTCGGMDLLANPQNRIFSPTSLFDLLLVPHLANLAVLVFFAFLGYHGMYSLARHLGRSKTASFVAAVLFINSSWFGLHFAEGHIAYGTMQLLPASFYFSLRINEKKYQFNFVALLALFLLDGGIYTFVYALILLLCAFFLRPYLANTRINRNDSFLLILALMFALISSPKLIPMLLSLADRIPFTFNTVLPVPFVVQSFFGPFQKLLTEVPLQTPHWGFHEYGCYVGIPVFLLALVSLRKNVKVCALAVLFFWIGSGWGGGWNPISILEHIPLINNIRVQSRFFLLMYLFVILLAATSLDIFRGHQLKIAVGLLIILEAFFVKSYPLWASYRDLSKPPETNRFITNMNLEETIPFAVLPGHYFLKNKGSVSSMDPANPGTFVLPNGHAFYRGEVFLTNKGGRAVIDYYVPGELKISYVNHVPGTPLWVNTNSLFGWTVIKGNAVVVPNKYKLLAFAPFDSDGSAVLKYTPYYFPYILLTYGLGLCIFFRLFLGFYLKPGSQL